LFFSQNVRLEDKNGHFLPGVVIFDTNTVKLMGQGNTDKLMDDIAAQKLIYDHVVGLKINIQLQIKVVRVLASIILSTI
jgi:hypothetical protein